MVYLIDKGRIVFTALDRVLARLTEANANLVAIPFDQNIALAMRQIERDQVPDMPDRIVAATALYVGVPVVSRDGKIKSSVVQTLW